MRERQFRLYVKSGEAATILDRIAERAERTGDLPLATAARALTLNLPLEDDPRAFRLREHRRLLAHVN